MYHLLEQHRTSYGRRVRVLIGSFENELEALTKKKYMEEIRKNCGYVYKIIDRDLGYEDMYPDD